MSQSYINVIGAGLAGSEAAYQIAERGIPVKLYEMRGVKSTPQHKTDNFAELVCSNSLRGDALTNAVGLLKEEMRRLGSVILESAEATRVPAGGALAVDRDGFSQMVTDKVANHPLIEVVRDEITELPTDVITVVATGPLTSDALAEKIHALNDGDGFYFYDAAAPIIDVNTIDMSKVYLKSRYDKGEAAYLNAPMTKQEFMDFHEALVNAEEAPLNSFEKEKYFEGCMPIEVMAKRGIKTMLYGPMKPVGLEYPDDYTGPRDGEFKTPYACLLYTSPNSDPTAKRLEKIETINREIIDMAGGAGSSNGTGGMLTKIKAATIATESGVPVYICSSLKSDALIEAAEETRDGSFFVAQEKGLRTQKQWLAFYAQSQGTIWVDGGAAEALSKNGKSLLLSGVVEVEGNFSYHDIVTVADKETGQSLGKGRVQFGVSALEDMLRSQKAKGVLIHRDDWISITPEIQLLFREF